MKPIFHAKSSAKKFGGHENDYLELHTFMDSSKACIATNLHRVLTHNTWFIFNVIPRVFGEIIINSDGKQVSTKELAELHVLEDFGMRFIPSPQDYIVNMEYQKWMNNGKDDAPESFRTIEKTKKTRTVSWQGFGNIKD